MRKKRMFMLLFSAAMLTGVTPAASIAAAEAEPVPFAQTASSGKVLTDQASGESFPLGSDMTVEQLDGEPVLNGKMALGENNTFASLLEGRNSWTFQVEYTPTSWADEYDMILARGDHNMTIRQNNYSGVSYLQIIIYTDAWTQLSYQITNRTSYLNQKHTLTAGYDAENGQIFLSLDGEATQTEDVTASASLAAADYPLWLGYCPETSRGSKMKFSSVKLAAGAKTKAEMDALSADDSVLSFTAADVHDPEVRLDLSLLQAAVDDCKDADLAVFVDVGKTEFSYALSAAQALLAAPTTQEALDEAAKELNTAWLALRRIPDANALNNLA